MRHKLLFLHGLLVLLVIGYLRVIWQPLNLTNRQPTGWLLPHNPALLGDVAHYLNGQKVDTVVVLAPNHQARGGPILTITDDEAFVNQEYAWTLYKDYFSLSNPATQVVPYLFRRGSTLNELSEFATRLKKDYPANTVLFIASVDFSHYTDAKTAHLNDQLTYSLIKAGEWDKLIKLDSSYLDCPECLVVFCQLFNNCSKLIIDNRVYLDGTSYMFGEVKTQ